VSIRWFIFGRAVDIEAMAGGAFRLSTPDGSVDVSCMVFGWSLPKRLRHLLIRRGLLNGNQLCAPAADAARIAVFESRLANWRRGSPSNVHLRLSYVVYYPLENSEYCARTLPPEFTAV
jgi:hypothetical protein